jgi:hypothetical protein
LCGRLSKIDVSYHIPAKARKKHFRSVRWTNGGEDSPYNAAELLPSEQNLDVGGEEANEHETYQKRHANYHCALIVDLKKLSR